MNRSVWKFGAVAVLAGAVSVAVMNGAGLTKSSPMMARLAPSLPSASPLSATASASPAAAASIPAVSSYADVVAKVTPGVVTIRTERKASAQFTQLPDGFPFGDLFGQRAPRGRNMPPQLQRGLGSGVIVTRDGYILTNHHVIEGAERIQVELSDRRTVEGKLIGADQPSDLAVVKVESKDMPTVAVGDSSAIRVGDVVLAIGNPLGVGQTVTMGIVSAKSRATGLGDGSFEDFLQTDAAINQGNSGGALVNTNGELVGINSQILSPSGGNIGIGFAVPSNMAKHVMDQLVAGGKVHRGQLGVTVQGVTSDLAAGLGLEQAQGALVSDVTNGSAAEKAGLQRGDVILGYQGRAVTDTNQLRNDIAATKPGSSVTLEVLRNGKKNTLHATLGELSTAEKEDVRGEARGGAARFGLTLQSLTPEIAAQLELPRNATGVVITEVDPTGRAASAGLREGDVIQQVNGRAVKTPSDVKSALEASTDRPAVLLVARDGRSVFVPLRAPQG
jgi:Do/DeqQ family serine protease